MLGNLHNPGNPSQAAAKAEKLGSVRGREEFRSSTSGPQ
jgi:hypothetical protein